MSFKFLCIPADISDEIQELEASLSGGLENDQLKRTAELFFSKTAVNKDAQLASLEEQMAGKGVNRAQIEGLLQNDDGSRVMGSVEIIALVLPSKANGYAAVSLYCDGNNAFKLTANQVNPRATALARACGHAQSAVMGTCFLGKAMDNEDLPWIRENITKADFDLEAPWVKEAHRNNAGRNLASSSTSGLLQQLAAQQQQKPAAAPKPAAVGPPPSEFSGKELYTWTENEEEVEVRMKVPAGTTSKQLQITFGSFPLDTSSSSTTSSKKKITFQHGALYIAKKHPTPGAPEARLEGVDERFSTASSVPPHGARLAGAIQASECSWSVADEREGRLLTVTLIKSTADVNFVHREWKSLFA